jgi:hypothetical protein
MTVASWPMHTIGCASEPTTRRQIMPWGAGLVAHGVSKAARLDLEFQQR